MSEFNLDFFDTFEQNQIKKQELYEPLVQKQIKLTEDFQEFQQEGNLKELIDQKIQNNYFLEQTELQFIQEDCGCHHEIIIPKSYKFIKQQQKPPAKKYPFVLDPFQQKSIECLEKNESVLVAAHTSAGKTVVAEYAIAMSFREKTRVIYTSPIKALSNQKYRDLSEEFKEVGLVTGDVTINENASCLVMTTEILRSMLYRGSEVVREVQWVIFDEVHYMRDKERGVVWEETIVLLNPNVRFVFLSATIPNAREFAEWIAQIKKQPCHVVYTEFRPTPLQHYLFPKGGQGIHMVVDDKGKFREDNFQKALACLGDNVYEQGFNQRKKNNKPTEGSDLFNIIKLIMDNNFNPVIIFSFSKKEVEGYALSMTKFDFTSEDEKEKIIMIFNSAMECLSQEDRQLPQITNMLPILKKGIGMHHGGLLPIVKETIEILFQEGCLKALFSTETFSMGLNMPAKTVVFTAVRKFDGENFRWIQGGEYIQMSGRAGRRGIDDRGITILMIDEKMEPDVAQNMLKGQSDPLISSFHLQYNMLLNCLRIEDTDPEYIIRRSLHQFQSQKQIPKMQEKLNQINQEQNNIYIQQQDQITEIYEFDQQLKIYKDKVQKIICVPEIILPFLSIGRLVYVKKNDEMWGWGVSLNFNTQKVNMKKKNDEQVYIVDVMLHIKKRKKNEEPKPIDFNQDGEMEVIPILLDCIYEVSSIRIMLPDDLTNAGNKLLVKETLIEFKNGFPLLNPLKDMKINSQEILKLFEKRDMIQQQKVIKENQIQNFQVEMEKFIRKQKLIKSSNILQQQISDNSKMVLENDLKSMKRVLRRLGHIDKDDIIQHKGKVACEISAADEIITTELMFSGIFSDMTGREIAALLSCLVHDENNKDEKQSVKTPKLSDKFSIVLEHARRIHKVFVDSKINIDEMIYLSSFRPQMIDVTFEWANGKSFAEICKMSNSFEGSIIRCLRRLDELLKQLINASKAIGNIELEQKFKESSESIKRGIVFAASLYVGF